MKTEYCKEHFHITTCAQMTPVGFEPTQLALVELESTPLDHSAKLSVLRFLGFQDKRHHQDMQHAMGKNGFLRYGT